MNKLMRAATTALLCAGLLASCAGNKEQVETTATSGANQEKFQIVCATFPAYDWTRQIVGGRADACEITYLMKSGVDLHSYQPTVDDITKIADADLFVYVGGESDEWAEDAIEAAANSDLRTVNMLAAVGDAAVEEEIVEGMEADEHDHDESEAEDHDHEDSPEYDEHVWLSLQNAQVIVGAITAELSAADPANAATYAANADAYKAELAALDARYAQAVADAPHDTVVFADRFPFRYLVDDYGLAYYAAFVGCSAETEASFETVAFLANKVDELGIGSVLVIETSDQRIAQTVIQNTTGKSQQILVMDSLQATTEDEAAAGKTYLSAMEANLDVLSTALA